MKEEEIIIQILQIAILAGTPIWLFFFIKNESFNFKYYRDNLFEESLLLFYSLVMLWAITYDSLNSGKDFFFLRFFFTYFFAFIPLWQLYLYLKSEREDFTSSFIFFIFIVTIPSSMLFFNWYTMIFGGLNNELDATNNVEIFIKSFETNFNGPIKLWHALYLFILAWYIKHHFYWEKEEKAIKKSTQTWMSYNLSVSNYRNGDVIPEVQDKTAWANLTTGAWCYYENANDKKYGKLYNWYAVNDPRGLAPKGYHIPSDEEWKILTDYLGDAAEGKMKSITGWDEDGNGINTIGFNAFPGGCRNIDGSFCGIGTFTAFWSSSEESSIHAKDFSLLAGYFSSGFNSCSSSNKRNGFSVRCLKD